MKKRLCLVLFAVMTATVCRAQVDAHYGVGAVPVINNYVTFEKTIPSSLSEQAAYEKTLNWVKGRFVEPTVLSYKTIEQDDTNHRLVIVAEEYLVFKRLWWMLDRTRITYLLEMFPAEGGVTMRMTRIKYWHEEERNGGQKFKAEEWITDEECFNDTRTKFLRITGKFRIKTIDLFDTLVQELGGRL